MNPVIIGNATLYLGDCIEVLKQLADNTIDSVVTDPPYELGFMGKKWDSTGIATSVEMWVECLRILKPGGHLLAFSGSRTYHRMTCAIEDAGFEIRDQIMWIYGSGFPKSHNGEWGGTALKPAHEPICMARKPLIGTVETNWSKHGTGALNIDDCRIHTGESLRAGAGSTFDKMHQYENRKGEASKDRRYSSVGSTDYAMLPGVRGGDPLGRWPANIIHDGSDEVLANFPDAQGQQGRVSGSEPTANGFSGAVKFGGMIGRIGSSEPRIELNKSAARFFYCAKASRTDRNFGCDSLPQSVGGMVSNTSNQHITRRDDGYQPRPQGNIHPTVKPTDLMAYLCRLVTPSGGVVLDPFMGSGSTGKAAMREGFRFIGIEMDSSYLDIASARISNEIEQLQITIEENSKQASLFDEAAA
ncbi:DNA-methyltransferase [Undibacterium sp. Rencai35W]|uniref:DNA-methyltransferase n=1 Tax=Undibacterium sp. Rencai35W TaxID=3413046 RepID=UPI003BF27B37